MNNPTIMIPARQASNRRQQGFSMVELMVAVVIGLFITLGLSEVFLNMYSTSSSQKALSQFQDNMRTGMLMMTNNIQQAGYYATPTSTTAATALPAFANSANNSTDTSTYVAGAGIVGMSGTGSGVNSDTIDVEYESGGFSTDQIINCQGGTAAAAPPYTIYYNSFFINSSSQLVCVVSSGAPGAAAGKASSQLVLASNVKQMSILYAVASTTQVVPSTGSWLTATQVTAANAWATVRAVQISLTFTIPAALTANTTSSSTNATTTTWTQTVSLMHLS